MSTRLLANASGGARRQAIMRLIAQFVSAVAAGVGVGYLGMQIGLRFFAGDPAGFGDIVARIGGMVVGYPIGCALGAWLTGRWIGRHGAFWASLLGAIAGVSTVVLGVRLLAAGAHDLDALRALLGIPDEVTPVGVIPIGHPAPTSPRRRSGAGAPLMPTMSTTSAGERR